MSPRYSLRVLAAAVLLASASTLLAQEVPAKQQQGLLTSARAQYYNLRAAGVKGFSCNADIDWPEFFLSINGKPIESNNPVLLYLQSSRLSVTSDLSGTPDVHWASAGAAPVGKEDAASKIRSGYQQVLSGFFQAWLPSLNGSLITFSPKHFTRTEAGYLIDDSTSPDSPDFLTLSKDLRITHLSTRSKTMSSEMDTFFTPSPDGLLLTQMDSFYHDPLDAPPTHVIMRADFQKVEGFQLPQHLSFTVSNVASFKMTLSGCTIQKL